MSPPGSNRPPGAAGLSLAVQCPTRYWDKIRLLLDTHTARGYEASCPNPVSTTLIHLCHRPWLGGASTRWWCIAVPPRVSRTLCINFWCGRTDISLQLSMPTCVLYATVSLPTGTSPAADWLLPCISLRCLLITRHNLHFKTRIRTRTHAGTHIFGHAATSHTTKYTTIQLLSQRLRSIVTPSPTMGGRSVSELMLNAQETTANWRKSKKKCLGTPTK